jgi:hypothetical protein
MNRQADINDKQTSVAPVALSFLLLGLFSLVAGTVAALYEPALLLAAAGDPAHTLLAHWLAVGTLGSFMFGASYLLLPVMAVTSLWSPRSAWIHLALHAVGLPWLLLGLANGDAAEAAQGALPLLAGLLLFSVNLMTTAGRHNRWDPANVTLVTALFWLWVTLALGLWQLLEAHLPAGAFAAHVPAWYVQFGAFGFLWMVLLGSLLKVFSMFLISPHQPGVFSWLGFVLLNSGLLLFIPAELAVTLPLASLPLWLIAAGSLAYALDLLLLVARARRGLDWDLGSAFAGLLLAGLIFAWALAGAPLPAVAAGNAPGGAALARVAFALALFGPFTLAVLGCCARLLPMLVWQIHCVPRIGADDKQPGVADLRQRAGLPAVCISAGAAWGFLAAGLLSGDRAGVQIGLMLLLIGIGWLYYVLFPAVAVILMGRLPAPAEAGKPVGQWISESVSQ